MTVEELRRESLALTDKIREAELRGDTETVMGLLRKKQPYAEALYAVARLQTESRREAEARHE